jgi:hypothetical protein
VDLKSYYRRAVWLPIVAPLPMSAVLIGLSDTGLPADGLFGFVGFVLLWSLILGGVPYLLFLIFFLAWMNEATEAQVRREVLRAPLRFASVMCTILFPFALSDGGGQGYALMWWMGAACLAVGYAYVGLAELVRKLLKIHPTPPDSPFDSWTEAPATA